MSEQQQKRRQVKVLWVSHQGLKAYDATHDLTDACFLTGENGEGKSSALEALHLMANGRVPGIDATADGIMSLSRDNRFLGIEVEILMPDGTQAHVSRTWTRDRKGHVKQEITNTHTTGSIDDHKRWLSEWLGSMPEAWSPEVFWDLSAGKMRQKLLRLIPLPEGKDLAGIVPANCPPYALPSKLAGDPEPHVWARFAITNTRKEITERQASIRHTEKELEIIGHLSTRSTAPLEAKLAELRQEKAESGAWGVVGPRIEKLRTELAQEEDLAVARAEPLVFARWAQGVVHAAVAAVAKRRRELEESLGKATADLRRIDQELSRLPLAPAAGPVTEDELTAERAALESDATRFAAAVETLDRQLRGWTESTVHECPNCKFDLRAAKEAERRVIVEERDLAVVERDMARTALKDVDAQLAALRAGARRAALVAERAQVLEIINAVEAEGRTLPNQQSVDQAECDVDAAVDCAADVEAARAKLPRIRAELADLETKQATLQGSAPRTQAEIEAETLAAQTALKELVKANKEAERAEALRKDLAFDEQWLDQAKGWLEVFLEIEQSLLRHAKGWLEERLSAVFGAGKKATVELVDARGNDDCTFALDGVPIHTLSIGNQMIFKSGLVIVLAGASEAPWRPLLVDKMEQVSAKYRVAFLRALKSAVDEGSVSQLIAAGCPDSVPAIEGIKSIHLDHSGPRGPRGVAA